MYKRWKQYAIKYEKLFWEYNDLEKIWLKLPKSSPEFYKIATKLNAIWENLKITAAEEQIFIMEKMKNHNMITDEQEKEIIDYCTSPSINRFDPWSLDWIWDL